MSERPSEVLAQQSGEIPQIRLTLPDGQVYTFPVGITPQSVAEQVNPRLAREAVVAKVNGRLVDLYRPITEDASIELLTPDDSEGLDVMRHSTAHLMAQALKRLFPGTKLAIGPTIQDGFYYDVDCPRPLTPDDLPVIEEEMRRIVAEDLPIRRESISKAEAERLFAELGETYKLELLEDLEDGQISLYRQGEFVDLCRGPHVPSTGRLKAFKLRGLAGAYWRGDARRPMLQRVYGTAFPTKSQLEAFLKQQEEAARRDHRRLGRELDLFSFHEAAPGFPFWHPKGFRVYRELENFSRQLQEARGYQEVSTPWIFRSLLWETSGHWGHFRQNMFTMDIEGETFGVKPMNCPAHCLLYKTQIRSYRDLPLKLAEYGPLARLEASGTLHGLLRVRGFHQDDAHLFVREDQIEAQVREVHEMIRIVYDTFGMPFRVKLATRPESFLGDPAAWDRAEQALAVALEAMGESYQINPGEGAFYGPKLEYYATDAIGREWQCATVQLDFNMPERFDLVYTDADGQLKRPVMIHRAIFGTLERFLGILVEHYAGAFPLWLAPIQVRVIPVSDRHFEYAHSVYNQLVQAGLRVELDQRDQKLGYKIRDAQVQQIPYMAVVGDRELEARTVAVRHRRQGDLGSQSVAQFIQALQDEIQSRR